jgi:integrase
MKGHIRKRGKDSWSIVIERPRDPVTGKRRQQWHTVKGTKRDAEKALRGILVGIDQGSYVRPNKITVGDWLTQWLNNYASMHVTARTLESYSSIIKRHLIPGLGQMALKDLEPSYIQSYYSRALSSGRKDGKGGLSARSVLYHHRILSKALSYGVKMGVVARNVAQLVEPPRARRVTMQVLSPSDVPRLLDAAMGSPYYVYYCVLLHCGLRRGEGLALRWRNLDLVGSELEVRETAFRLHSGEYIIKEPKTPHSRRRVSLTPSLAMLLRKYREDQELISEKMGRKLLEDDFVFCRPDGRPLDPDSVTRRFSEIVRKAGIPRIRLHDLRHTHATLMLKAGVHPKVVSERLGHASIAVTLDTYSHVLPGLQEAAAERFDRMLEEEPTSASESGYVSKMFASGTEVEREPHRTRTCNRLIKSQLLYQLS